MPSKTLNEHLFDTLDRLSSADADNINLEIDKATSIIAVSEQVLNVARLKIDILQLKENGIEKFTEIDDPDSTGSDKKKLTS